MWAPAHGGPLLLLAGGSAVDPLMAMLRLRPKTGVEVDALLLASSRNWDDIVFRDELERLSGHGRTRAWNGFAGAVTMELPVGPS